MMRTSIPFDVQDGKKRIPLVAKLEWTDGLGRLAMPIKYSNHLGEDGFKGLEQEAGAFFHDDGAQNLGYFVADAEDCFYSIATTPIRTGLQQRCQDYRVLLHPEHADDAIAAMKQQGALIQTGERCEYGPLYFVVEWDAKNCKIVPRCIKCEQVSFVSYCSKCKTAPYCSKKCQAGDWSVHKTVCQSVKRQRQPTLQNHKTIRATSCVVCDETSQPGLHCKECKIAQYCSSTCMDNDHKNHSQWCLTRTVVYLNNLQSIDRRMPQWMYDSLCSKATHGPVAKIAGLPLGIVRYSTIPEYLRGIVPRMDDNQHATYFMINPKTGLAPLDWISGVGPAVVMRLDDASYSRNDHLKFHGVLFSYLGYVEDEEGIKNPRALITSLIKTSGLQLKGIQSDGVAWETADDGWLQLDNGKSRVYSRRYAVKLYVIDRFKKLIG